MDGKKVYQIQINGVTESINAIESLNKQLNTLDAKVTSLENRNVKVKTSGGGSSTSTLSEEVALEKELNNLKNEGIKLDAKIEAAQSEIYKSVQATKDLYKETVADQKAMAAQERLTADAYSNTMQGMKQKLADLKSVINTTDLGDSDSIKKMTSDANELTKKLKEMEEAYGQFGRNVGNYGSAFNDLQKITVNVGGTIREFSNAREASRTLGNELKAMAMNGQKGTQAFKELQQAVLEMESTMQDAKKPMDNLMDTMESFMAIASVSKGLSALFGIDDNEIQRSIQKLVALQNVLNGIQTINKQLSTREGVGAWIAPFITSIDKATAKLLVFNRALLGTSKAAKVAAASVKLFSKAVKLALSAGILIAVDLLVEGIMKLVESFKKVDEEAERAKETQKELAETYGKAKGKITQYKTIVDNFNGSKKEEKRLVEQLNKELGNTLGTYNSLAKWQDTLKKKADAYVQSLVNQAKVQAALNEVTAAYMNLEKVRQDNAAGKNGGWLTTQAQQREKDAYDIEQANKRIEKAEEKLKEAVGEADKYDKENGLGDYSNQIEKNGKKSADTIKKIEEEIRKKEIDAMQDGLNKKLMQLDEEERQTIAKLKENGRKTADEIKKVQNIYATLRQREIQEYINKLTESLRQSANAIKSIQFSIDTTRIKNEIFEVKNDLNKLSEDRAISNTLLSKAEIKEMGADKKKLLEAAVFQSLFDISEATNKGDEYYKYLLQYLEKKNKEVISKVKSIYDSTEGSEEEKRKAYFGAIEEMFEKEYAKELEIVRYYTTNIDDTLADSISRRLTAQDVYDKEYRNNLLKNIEYNAKLNEKLIKQETSAATESESERYSIQMSGLTAQKKSVKEGLKAIEDSYKVSGLEGVETLKETNKKEYALYHELFAKGVEIDAQIQEAKKQHKEKLKQITAEGNLKIEENEINTAKNIASEQEKYFDEQISNLRDAQSKISEILSKQPVMNKLGIVNLSATKKQYNELKNAATTTLNAINQEKAKLDAKWKKGLITPEARNAITQQLNNLESEIKQLFASILNESKQRIPKFVQSCQQYLTEALDSFSTIMNAVWNAQDTAFDKEQEQINETNDALSKALDKQEEIIEEHKSAIDSIEDELSSARGDRRQKLIDQINAEVAAERAAQKEKARIEKQQEAQERKQEELDKKRKEADYNRQLIQAIVNGAMAVTYAAMNSWPIPAIPMMALAASTTAAQIAIMKANKPYAKGGLLEGKSHAEGGIPVGNTGIEVEGKEYVIRKKSTAPNLDVLDYINKSERKLTLDDFIDFYSSGKAKRIIASASPTRHFADGGSLPMLNDNYEFDDRLLQAFEKYAQRPSYVSVVDINSRQADVRNIEVLAGLKD